LKFSWVHIFLGHPYNPLFLREDNYSILYHVNYLTILTEQAMRNGTSRLFFSCIKIKRKTLGCKSNFIRCLPVQGKQLCQTLVLMNYERDILVPTLSQRFM